MEKRNFASVSRRVAIQAAVAGNLRIGTSAVSSEIGEFECVRAEYIGDGASQIVVPNVQVGKSRQQSQLRRNRSCEIIVS